MPPSRGGDHESPHGYRLKGVEGTCFAPRLPHTASQEASRTSARGAPPPRSAGPIHAGVPWCPYATVSCASARGSASSCSISVLRATDGGSQTSSAPSVIRRCACGGAETGRSRQALPLASRSLDIRHAATAWAGCRPESRPPAGPCDPTGFGRARCRLASHCFDRVRLPSGRVKSRDF